jgi:hypothetical protein
LRFAPDTTSLIASTNLAASCTGINTTPSGHMPLSVAITGVPR